MKGAESFGTQGVGWIDVGESVGEGMTVADGAGEDVGASDAGGQKNANGLSRPRCEKK